MKEPDTSSINASSILKTTFPALFVFNIASIVIMLVKATETKMLHTRHMVTTLVFVSSSPSLALPTTNTPVM